MIVLAVAGCDTGSASTPSVAPSEMGAATSGATATAVVPTAIPSPSGPSGGEPWSPFVPPLRAPFPPAMSVASSEALLVVSEDGDIGPNVRQFALYDDGSVLVPSTSEFGGPGVRRLSTQGVAHLLGRLSATGAFDRSRDFPPRPGWDSGWGGYTFEYSAAGRRVRVSATNASSDPMARKLIALGDAMRDLPSLLPAASDWAAGDRSLHPFQPASGVVTVQQVSSGDVLLDLPDERIDVLAPFLPGPLDTLGVEVSAADGSRSGRCAAVGGKAVLALHEAAARRFALIQALSLVDASTSTDLPFVTGVDLRSEAGGAVVRVAWRAARPGEAVRCDGGVLPPAPVPGAYWGRGADMVLASTGGITPGVGLSSRLTVEITEHEMTRAVLYLDGGTVVTFPPRAPLAGFGIRRLTEAGVGALDVLVAGAGLPNAPRDPPTSLDDPGAMYAAIFPDRIVQASEHEVGAEARRIVDFVRRLIEPEQAFAAFEWRDPQQLPYRPQEVEVSTQLVEAADIPRATLAMISPPLDPAMIGDLGETRCTVLPIDDALALARSMRAITAPAGDSFWFATGSERQVVEMKFELLGPMDPAPSCD